MKTDKKSPVTQDINQEKNTLFSSIIAQEDFQKRENYIVSLTNRVGIVLKVLYNRDLSSLRIAFEDKLSALVQEYCNYIDDELSSQKTNC